MGNLNNVLDFLGFRKVQRSHWARGTTDAWVRPDGGSVAFEFKFYSRRFNQYCVVLEEVPRGIFHYFNGEAVDGFFATLHRSCFATFKATEEARIQGLIQRRKIQKGKMK